MTHPMGIVDHCDVRLPEGMGRALDRIASQQKCTRSELIRRIICEAIDYYPPERAPEELPPQPACKALPAKPAPGESLQVLDLFTRGYTASQIAAVKRIPYKRVMELIGTQIDRKAVRARSDKIPP